MQHQFAVRGAGYGALVGWASAALVMASALLDLSGDLFSTVGLVLLVQGTVMSAAVGLSAGALVGLVCGMGAAMAVGDRTVTREALPRVVIGAAALPLVVVVGAALVTRSPGPLLLLVPVVVGVALLVAATPRILRDTEQRRVVTSTVRPG